MSTNILVSGSHRSGSTWTGRVIAEAQGVRYVHEPFNLGIKRANSPIEHWFEYVSKDETDNEQKIDQYLQSFLRVRMGDVLTGLSEIREIRKLKGFVVNLVKIAACSRTIIKDPIAIMSVEWLFQELGLDIVLMIRHPAAFVASLKMKNWKFNFSNFLEQPLLMKSLLVEYEQEILEACKNEKDIIEQGVLLWNVIHSVIWEYSLKYKDEWFFIKHEDLSRNPHEEFKKMFAFLGIKYSDDVDEYITATSESSTKGNLERDSKANIMSWKKRLSDEEIIRIKEGTFRVWPRFYSEAEW